MVSEAKWQMLAEWQNGKRPEYANGIPFRPRHVFQNILGPRHIDDMLNGKAKHYAPGGTNGLTEITIDIDAHEPWQDDLEETTAKVMQAVGPEYIFAVPSTRGGNNKMKISGCANIEEADGVFEKLDSALKKLTAHNKCTVEVKGKIGTGKSKGQRGTQAKLACYGAWSWERLEEYKALPVVSLTWLKELVSRIEAKAEIKNDIMILEKPRASPVPVRAFLWSKSN